MLQQIGRYEILRKIGQGGMGIVYEARHTRLDKVVALKVLPIEASGDKELIARFEREMRAAGQVKHPGFVQALDADEADGYLYLAMELVDGCDLARYCAQVLKGRPLPVGPACEIIRQASVAMHHANRNGLVHRDLKPSNLMVTRNGKTKILDLGLATFTSKNTDLVSKLTTTGKVVGTLDYMSPEQVSGDRVVDHRTDIYALGATLYYLLCGQVLYPNQSFPTVLQKLQAIVGGKPSQFAANTASWPSRLRETVARAIAKSPEQRFSDTSELAEQLEEFADAEALLTLLGSRPEADGFKTMVTMSNGMALTKADSHLDPVQHLYHRRYLFGGLFALGACGLLGAWSVRSLFEQPELSPFKNDIEAARWIISKGGDFISPHRKANDILSMNAENLSEAAKFQLWGMTWKGQDITPAEINKFRKCIYLSMLYMDVKALTSEHVTAITKIHAGDALVLHPRNPFRMEDRSLKELLANANKYWALGFRNVYGSRFDLSPLRDKLSLICLMIAGDSNADRSVLPRLDQHCIDSIGEFPNLISLDLRYSIIEASDFRGLFALSKLKRLYLSGTESNRILAEMPASMTLSRLDLDNCDLTEVYSKLLEMKSLKHLSLVNCQLRKAQLENLVQALPECYLVTDFGNIRQPTLKADFGESWFYPKG